MHHRNSRGSVLAAVALTAVAGLALTACDDDGTSAAGTGAAGPAAPGGHQHAGMAAAPASALGKYDREDASDATFFASVLTGDNEVPVKGQPPVGDKDGVATALMRIQGDQVSFAFAWRGIGTPTMAHVHEGVRGRNGTVRIPFFTSKLRDGRHYVYGTVKVGDPHLLRDLRTHPEKFYFNLHTAAFPGGAVRGQVHRLPRRVSLPDVVRDSSAHSVVKGAQVYACTKQPDGGYAFTQDNVDATLTGGVVHTFAEHGPAGPPRWEAPDGSSVTGTAVNKIDNGSGNIPELILKGVPAGKPGGEFSDAELVLRVNTRGGVAPSGTCNPHARPQVQVPYRADYLFLGDR